MTVDSRLEALWGRVDAQLLEAHRRLRPLAASVPVNLREEHGRLLAAQMGGKPLRPAWRYAACAPAELRAAQVALEAARAGLRELPQDGWRAAYEARLEELLRSLVYVASIGRPEALRASIALYGEPDETLLGLAQAWLRASGIQPDTSPLLPLDEMERRAQAAIRERDLPIRFVWAPELGARAALGRHSLMLRPEAMRERQLMRFLVHELDGHARSAQGAASMSRVLAAVGTAESTCDQEGVSLACEAAAGYLDAGRQREIGARYLAAHAVAGGASFEATCALLTPYMPPASALEVSERAFRGGGTVRDAIYLRGYLKVKQALEKGQASLDTLQCGKCSVRWQLVALP